MRFFLKVVFFLKTLQLLNNIFFKNIKALVLLDKYSTKYYILMLNSCQSMFHSCQSKSFFTKF